MRKIELKIMNLFMYLIRSNSIKSKDSIKDNSQLILKVSNVSIN